MNFEIIDTERLLLRKLGEQEYNYIFTQLADEEIGETLGLDTGGLAKEKEKYKKGLTTHNKSILIFQLIDKASDKVIGGCGYHTWYVDHRRAEIGYALTDESYKGRGIMSEACAAVITYGFNTMNLNRIEAFIGPDNLPSIKLVEKFNFKREGELREHYNKNGIIENSVIYSKLRSEHI